MKRKKKIKIGTRISFYQNRERGTGKVIGYDEVADFIVDVEHEHFGWEHKKFLGRKIWCIEYRNSAFNDIQNELAKLRRKLRGNR